MLRKKNHRHDAYWVRIPATNGPMAEPARPTPDQIPSAFARSSGAERVVHDGDRHREDRAATDTLHDARADQEDVRRREAAPDGTDDEEDDADERDLAPPDDVGEAADRDHRRHEREQVAVDGPEQCARRRVQVLADRGERDGEPEEVEREDDHHARHGHDDPPLPGGVVASGTGCRCGGYRARHGSRSYRISFRRRRTRTP